MPRHQQVASLAEHRVPDVQVQERKVESTVANQKKLSVLAVPEPLPTSTMRTRRAFRLLMVQKVELPSVVEALEAGVALGTWEEAASSTVVEEEVQEGLPPVDEVGHSLMDVVELPVLDKSTDAVEQEVEEVAHREEDSDGRIGTRSSAHGMRVSLSEMIGLSWRRLNFRGYRNCDLRLTLSIQRICSSSIFSFHSPKTGADPIIPQFVTWIPVRIRQVLRSCQYEERETFAEQGAYSLQPHHFRRSHYSTSLWPPFPLCKLPSLTFVPFFTQ